MAPVHDVKQLAKGVLAGDKRWLSQAITCIESRQDADILVAELLLEKILPHAGKSLRVGVTGVPGAGKSSLIEVLGMHILKQAPSEKIAVLTVDPTSHRSQGSILADKSRMHGLSRHTRAYIRPSPNGLTPGGIARNTQEAIWLCEAAGFTYVFVETVGVGQTELAIRQAVDCVLVLMLAGAGDQWQGLKRGIVEIADLLLVHKDDGKNKTAVKQAIMQYRSTMQMIPPHMPCWPVPVLRASSHTGTGVHELWQALQHFAKQAQTTSYIHSHRKQQGLAQLEKCLLEALATHLHKLPAYKQAQHTVATGNFLSRKFVRTLLYNTLQPSN